MSPQLTAHWPEPATWSHAASRQNEMQSHLHSQDGGDPETHMPINYHSPLLWSPNIWCTRFYKCKMYSDLLPKGTTQSLIHSWHQTQSPGSQSASWKFLYIVQMWLWLAQKLVKTKCKFSAAPPHHSPPPLTHTCSNGRIGTVQSPNILPSGKGTNGRLESLSYSISEILVDRH